MSLNGISSGYAQRPLPSTQTSTTSVRDELARQQGARQVVPFQPPATHALRAPAGAPGALAALPAEAPAGTDPALWSILSVEERSFFAKAQAMGPLTYGRKMTERMEPAMPAVRGGRLDIRG
jgi:hypothetical protein